MTTIMIGVLLLSWVSVSVKLCVCYIQPCVCVREREKEILDGNFLFLSLDVSIIIFDKKNDFILGCQCQMIKTGRFSLCVSAK